MPGTSSVGEMSPGFILPVNLNFGIEDEDEPKPFPALQLEYEEMRNIIKIANDKLHDPNDDGTIIIFNMRICLKRKSKIMELQVDADFFFISQIICLENYRFEP